MSDVGHGESAAARGVRAMVDGLSAAQPQVVDWPAGVRRAVARRRARRAAAAAAGALALAAMFAGTAGALNDEQDELVAGPAPQPSASPTPASIPSSSRPAPTPEATAVPTAPAPAPGTTATAAPPAPARSQIPEQSPAAAKLPSCGPAPAPTDGDVVLALRFPERVNASTVGVLRVTNRGDEPAVVNVKDDESAFAVRDRQIVSTGASNGMGQAPTTLGPGEHREVRVRVFSYLCDGDFDRRLPQGSYQVQSTLWINENTQVVSPPVSIIYDPDDR